MAANCSRLAAWVESAYGTPCLLLPNMYHLDGASPKRELYPGGTLRIAGKRMRECEVTDRRRHGPAGRAGSQQQFERFGSGRTRCRRVAGGGKVGREIELYERVRLAV